LSWSWRSIKLLLLHLVGVPYYFTYNDDARSHTNQVYISVLNFLSLGSIIRNLLRIKSFFFFFFSFILLPILNPLAVDNSLPPASSPVRHCSYMTCRLAFVLSIFLVLISVRDLVNSKVTVRLEKWCQWKITLTPLGIEPATSRLVAQCATACPLIYYVTLFNLRSRNTRMFHSFVLLRSYKQIIESSCGVLHSFIYSGSKRGIELCAFWLLTFVLGWADQSSREFIEIRCLIIKSESEQIK
jgi:hypothetical protein